MDNIPGNLQNNGNNAIENKGVCNFTTSKIQTWPLSTIKSNFIHSLLGAACSNVSRYWNQLNKAMERSQTE